MSARYVVGIDLGTTHCAISYASLERDDAKVVDLAIPQSVSVGEVANRPLLPSFLYIPAAGELPAGATALPWSGTPAYLVGELARSLGAKSPGRLVSSAKSWLGHPSADRRGAIVPVDAPESVAKISPITAAVQYLKHLQAAWNHAHPDAPLAEQEVVITVPASFDPAARGLTLEAAQLAGYPDDLTLVEEPQAALYAWLDGKGESWREELEVGDQILVVDVGGGTTDFSLISVGETDGQLELTRVAVGDHILLGGDNADIALAYLVTHKLESAGKKVDDVQKRALVPACRAAKEQILSGDVESVPIAVAKRGSKLLGGTLRAELTRGEVEQILLEGFFPRVAADERPQRRTRAALTQLGLPYAHDAAVTKHLAAFLGSHAEAAPTKLLLNGGVFRAESLAARLHEVLGSWRESGPARLAGVDLDQAVARGAVVYGLARQQGGLRIRGGLAKTYYVGVEGSAPAIPGFPTPMQALCIAPFGLEEGDAAEPPPMELGLVVGERVGFRFFGSSVRHDPSGALLPSIDDEELVELDEIEAELPVTSEHGAGAIVPVRLRARLSELGHLAIEALPRDGGEPWRIEWNVRDVEARG